MNPEQEQPCALRALTLCDGHVLEDLDHALKACLCDVEELARRVGLTGMAAAAAYRRTVLSGRAMDMPPPPPPDWSVRDDLDR